MENNNAPNTNFSNEARKYVLSFLLDAGIVFSVLIACLYFLGLNYYLAFFSYYSIGVNAYMLPFEAYLTINLEFILASVLMAALVFLFVKLVKKIEKRKLRSGIYFRKAASKINNKKYLRKFRRYLKKLRNKSPLFLKIIIVVFQDIFFYLNFFISFYFIAIILFLFLVFFYVGTIQIVKNIAIEDVLTQCKEGKNIIFNAELKDDFSIPPDLHLLSYAGEKWVILYSENTDCNSRTNNDFTVLSVDEIKKFQTKRIN